MLFSTVEDRVAGASWQKLLKMPPANANTKTEKPHCAQDMWGTESTKGEAPALLKSVGKSPLTSAKPVLYLRLSHGQHSSLASLAMQGDMERTALQMGFDNKFPGLGKC